MQPMIAMAALLLTSGPTLAQQAQPYVGLETRSIKTLSDQQIADLKAGRGMGLSLAAELNGYPGPIHAIEMAEPLKLSADQRARLDELFAAMKAEAIPIGTKLIAEEARLNEKFADKTVAPASLKALTSAIGATQAELRATHLKFHLATVAIFTPEQVTRYKELRGYMVGSEGHQHNQHSMPR
jgi:hypothetical protein